MTADSAGLDAAFRAPAAVRRMGDAARRWLDALGAQRERALFSFDDDERFVWTYRPGPRRGVPLADMNDNARARAMALVDAALSARGAAEVRAIMALEPVLRELERLAGRADWERRDPERYWFAIFGEPGARTPWAWRIGGHHVAVHVTVVDGAFVAVTPLFFGANPATVPHGSHAGQRTLAAEEDLARDLLGRLTPAQKALAIVDAVAPDDILTKNYRVADPALVPRGVRYAALGGEQRDRLVRLLRHYVDRAAPEIAEAEWQRIEAGGLDAVAFAWAGPETRGHGHYYAVHGPCCLIEYDNTQNDANHIHAVWRAPSHDWGEDLLAAHYSAAHRGGPE